jgi:hypothetical protein
MARLQFRESIDAITLLLSKLGMKGGKRFRGYGSRALFDNVDHYSDVDHKIQPSKCQNKPLDSCSRVFSAKAKTAFGERRHVAVWMCWLCSMEETLVWEVSAWWAGCTIEISLWRADINDCMVGFTKWARN